MAEWIIEANDTEEAAEGKFTFIREVVRCKDCKYHDDEEPGMVWCPNMDCFLDENWFCADGDRRKDDGKF